MKGKVNAFESRNATVDENRRLCEHGYYYRDICPTCGARDYIERQKQIQRELGKA